MLVLTRKVKESLIIDNNIKITVVAIDGDKVKLAIDAPKEIPILRQEVLQAIERENRESLAAIIKAKELSQLKDLLPQKR